MPPNAPNRYRAVKTVSREAFIALRKAIRYLAHLDSDHASKRNCRGFNKPDSKIGHTLARKEKWTSQDLHKAIELANRYRRQLPKDLKKSIPRVKTRRSYKKRPLSNPRRLSDEEAKE